MDKEYLPSIQRAEFERRNTMPPDNKKQKAIDEKMGLESYVGEHAEQIEALDEKDKLDDPMEKKNLLYSKPLGELKPDLDAIEKRINKMADMALPDDGDQEEPMTLDRKIFMMAKIFPLAIGDQIKNKLDEKGLIDLVGLDSRGVIYLVRYPEGRMVWETDYMIEKVDSHLASELNAKDPTIKTDIPEDRYTGRHRVG